MNLDLMVVNPVYVENLGMFLREAQLSGANKVYLQDKFNLLDEENKQRLLQWSSKVSYYNPPIKVEEVSDFLNENKHSYRSIATIVDNHAESIFDFRYGENDLLIFGDERNGLDKEIVSLCDKKIYIPQFQPESKRKKIQCRTLVSAEAIFLYEFMRQTGKYR